MAVEFAILAPALLLMLLGTAQFGLTLNQYVMLWNGAGAGAIQFALSGGIITSASSLPQPATLAWKAITQNAPILSKGSCAKGLCVTLKVNGTACASNLTATPTAAQDSACNTALTAKAANGTPALVTATYPCDLIVMQYKFLPTCTLQAQVSEFVQ